MSRHQQVTFKPYKNDKSAQRRMDKLMQIQMRNASKRNVELTADIGSVVSGMVERSHKQYEDLLNDTRSKSN